MKATGLSATIFLKKETPTYVFSCEFCEIFKNTFFYIEHPRWMLLSIQFCLGVLLQLEMFLRKMLLKFEQS